MKRIYIVRKNGVYIRRNCYIASSGYMFVLSVQFGKKLANILLV